MQKAVDFLQNKEPWINKTINKIQTHLKKVDGVMIGRVAYHSPYFLAEVEKEIFFNQNIPTRVEVMERMIPYIKEETKKGTRINQIMRRLLIISTSLKADFNLSLSLTSPTINWECSAILLGLSDL